MVQFGTPVSQELIITIPGIDKLNKVSELQFQLTTKSPEQLRRQLMELALQHHLNIVSMHSESQSLESVFKTLTASSDVNEI